MRAAPQAGFTLIELMIVVAIIGILAAIAMPQYQNYVSRSRWSDNLARLGHLKQAVAECAQNNNSDLTAPACIDIAALIANGFLATNYVVPSNANSPYLNAAVTLNAGVLTIPGNALASGCTVTVTANIPAGRTTVNWDFANVAGVGCNRSKTGVGT